MARVIYGGAQRGGAGMGEDFSTVRAARWQRSSPERGVPAPKGHYSLRFLVHKDQKAEELLTVRGIGRGGGTVVPAGRSLGGVQSDLEEKTLQRSVQRGPGLMIQWEDPRRSCGVRRGVSRA